ncbi:GntR family transcriptional regulator [Kocuria dechangensis]|jgi:DNA-binding GntR family transcriptional regulator|uniref:GntR family transcriptional regulator n=1 Tax=Kocuria dechangensis TaxID=1176249 RepID=A0A917M105_9MICC|nr:GntR family transcriptional regulator [Kocuria dechangensis]GGG70828.1 GntR family transcriptional regulator [Kocuria dechangensis]
MSVIAITGHVGKAPPSLADQAYNDLRDRLTMLEIRPGDPLNDGQLAAELGIGRTPVREAIKRLETDHLVVSYPRRGTFATKVDITELSDVSELRRHLEPLAAHKAALSAPADVRRQLRALVGTLGDLAEGAPTRQALLRTDLAVHRLVYRAAGNAHLEEALVRLDNLATRIWCLVLDRTPLLSGQVHGHVHEHVDLLEAILAGQGERAAHLALQHVADFEKTLRTVL